MNRGKLAEREEAIPPCRVLFPNGFLKPLNIYTIEIRLEPVQVLVNNAAGPAAGPLLDASDDDLLRAFQRHVLASHLLERRVLPGMRTAATGG